VTTAGADAARVLAERYADVVESLTAPEWNQPSRCAGWTVRDLVAHTGSNFRVVVEPPDTPADPGMTAEALQEALVRDRAAWSAEEVAAEFLQYREPAVQVFAALQEEPTASAPMTLSDLGTYPTHTLADAFAFDLWCHLYVDLLAPEGPVRREVDSTEDEILRPGIGWMLTGLPQMCPPVGAVLDKPLGLRLTGPGGGEWSIGPGEPFPVVTAGLTDVAATVTSAATDFVLWGTKRSDWRTATKVEGDEAYAATVLDALNIV
jgi:uncharacterized protein (TIGR03083 family)